MTPFLWILTGGFGLGIILMIMFGIAGSRTGMTFGIALAIVSMACFMIDITVEPHKNGYVPPEEEVSVVSFSELHQAYEENEIVADEIYKGNRYQVTGEIARISNGGVLGLGEGATLTVDVALDHTIVVVTAIFEKDQIESLKSVKVGDTITFTGTCLSDRSWSECELVWRDTDGIYPDFRPSGSDISGI